MTTMIIMVMMIIMPMMSMTAMLIMMIKMVMMIIRIMVFMMIVMIYCPVYEVDSSGNPLSPTKAVKGRVDRFLGGEGGSCGGIAMSIQVCR